MNLRKIVRSHWKNVIPALAVIVVVAMAVIVVPAVTEQSPTQRKTDGTAGTGRPQPGKKSGVGPGQGKTPAGSSTTNPSAANDGTSEPPNTGSPSVGGSPSHPIQVKALTTGHEVLKPGSSVQTASIHGGPGGMVLVWVGGLVGGDQPAPAPSVSGAGLGTFRMLETTVKKEDSPRRLSLFGANVPSHPVSGRIRIDFGQQLASSEWIWAVVHEVAARPGRSCPKRRAGSSTNTRSTSRRAPPIATPRSPDS